MALVLAMLQLAVCVAAGWCFCLAWQRRHPRDIYVYIWPLPHLRRRHQEDECAARAQELLRLRRHIIPGLQAQWNSGLGREFPVNHCN